MVMREANVDHDSATMIRRPLAATRDNLVVNRASKEGLAESSE